MKRKIMMLTSIWKAEYACRVTEGVYRCLADEGYDLYIFNAYDMRGNDSCFLLEHRIYSLPDVREFDGVLIAINSLGTEHLVKDLVNKCKELNKPVISIDQRFEGVHLAGIDNRKSMYKLVEHLVKEHGCTQFNYLGGPEDHEENKQRFQGFCDCLKDNHIELEPERVSHRSFLTSDGARAYNGWEPKGLHIPQVVVCANDEMALGYTLVAAQHGYRVPEDLMVTGFDNMVDGQKSIPSITSVKRCWEELGYRSTCLLMGMIRGENAGEDLFLDGEVVLNESCGCTVGQRSVKEAYATLYRENKSYEKKEEIQRNVRQLLCECTDRKELQSSLIVAAQMCDISEIAVCINQPDEHHEDRYFADRVRVLCGETSEIIDTNKQLIPSKWISEDREPSIYIFGPLYCGKKHSGYAIIHYEPDFLPERKHKTLLESIGLSLASILRNEELNETNQRLSELYVQDSLTGLYNRFGYKQEGFRYFEEKQGKVYLAYFDIDGLKKINDTYGHAMGDIAISSTARAIREIFCEGQVCVRMGGDEFLVIGSMSEHIESKDVTGQIDTLLQRYSQELNLPIDIRSSIGGLQNEGQYNELEEMVKKADKMMYEIKTLRKARAKEQQNM